MVRANEPSTVEVTLTLTVPTLHIYLFLAGQFRFANIQTQNFIHLNTRLLYFLRFSVTFSLNAEIYSGIRQNTKPMYRIL